MATHHAKGVQTSSHGTLPSGGLFSQGIRVVAGAGLFLSCAGLMPDPEQESRAPVALASDEEAPAPEAAAVRIEKLLAAMSGSSQSDVAKCSSECSNDGTNYSAFTVGDSADQTRYASMSVAVDQDGAPAATSVVASIGNAAAQPAPSAAIDSRPSRLALSSVPSISSRQPAAPRPRTSGTLPLAVDTPADVVALNEVDAQPEPSPTTWVGVDADQGTPTAMQPEHNELRRGALPANSPIGRREAAMSRGIDTLETPYERPLHSMAPPVLPTGLPEILAALPAHVPTLVSGGEVPGLQNGYGPMEELFHGRDPLVDRTDDLGSPPSAPTTSPFLQPISEAAFNGPAAVLAAVVPEPSTLALLGAALWGLAASGTSRRKKSGHRLSTESR